MPKVSAALTNFTAGELSPRLQGRTDLEKYFNGCKVMENMTIHPHGGASRRPGTKFIHEVKTSANSTRLIPFEFSTTQTYIMEFGNNYIRFFKDGGIITEGDKTISAITQANPAVVTSSSHGYSNGDFVIITGVVGMTEVNGKTFKVADKTTNTFELQTIDGVDINSSGYTAYGSAGTINRIYQITTSYATADLFTLKYAQSADTMYIVHPTYKPQKLTRSGHTSWTIGNYAPTADPFTSTNNYPSCVAIYEERLVFANTNANPQKIFFTKSGDFENATTGTNADDGLTFTIGSDQVNAVRYLSSMRTLIIGTTGGEFTATASSTSEPITPTNIQIKRQSAYGSANVDVVPVANVTLFLQRAKRKLRELVYDYNVDSYVAPDLTILAEHVTKSGVTQLSYQQEPDSIIWTTRTDGILAGLTYQRVENVVGWHRHILGGKSDTTKNIIQQSKSFTSNASNVSTTNNTITISSHGFTTGDAVYYYAASNPIGGLKTDRLYYLISADSNTIKLAENATLATAGTAISLTTAPGSDTTQFIYQGVNIENDTLHSAAHGLNTHDEIFYDNTGTSIGGLSENIKYYVKKINDNEFKLSTRSDFSSFVALTSAHTSEQTDNIFTNSIVESVATIPGDLNEDITYMIVKRIVNGAVRRYVEYFSTYDYGDDIEDAFYIDSGLTYNGAATTSISGLDHLEGETVTILADGASHPNKVVSNGTITLDRSSSIVQIGLSYTSLLETMQLEVPSQEGTSQGKIKRIHDVTVRFHKTVGAQIGSDEDDMETINFRTGNMPMNTAITPFSGDKEIEFRGDYDANAKLIIRQTQPLPMTVLAIYPRLSSNEG